MVSESNRSDEWEDRVGRLESLVRRDPADRGLISSEADRGVLCEGHLAGAALSLSSKRGPVAILTGFFIPHGDPPAAETDGPPGAVTLARVLAGLGREVVLVTDEPCGGAMRATAAAAGLGDLELAVAPPGRRGILVPGLPVPPPRCGRVGSPGCDRAGRPQPRARFDAGPVPCRRTARGGVR